MSTKTHHFRIPEPCNENWNDMSPTEKGRFCDSCAKEVKDFSKSTHDEIAATLLSSETKVCGRFRKEQLAAPSPKLINLIPTRPAHVAKVAAAALAFFTCDAAVSQSQLEVIDVGSVVHTITSASEASIRKVRGIVRDENGEPLPFVNVTFKSDLGPNRGAATDFDGLFEIEVMAEDLARNEITLTATYVGYKERSITVPIGEDQFIEIRLDDTEYLLMGDVIEIPATQEEQNEIEKEFHRVKAWADEAENNKREQLQDRIVKGDVAIIEEEDFLRGEAMIMEENSETKIDSSSALEAPINIQAIDLEAMTEVTKVLEPVCGDYMVGGAVAYTISETFVPFETVIVEEATTIPDEEKTKAYTEEGLHFDLFPNPSSDMLTIKSIGSPVSNYRIMDMNGKLVLEGAFTSEILQIDISGLENGNYLFIRIENDLERVSKQFIVAH